MDNGREAGFSGSVGGGLDNWIPGSSDQLVWATEDDYAVWNGDGSGDTPSNSNYDGRQSQSRSGSEPPSKKSRSSQAVDSQGNVFGRDRDLPSNRSKAIGKMFFKTKLCCKFRAGTCPYVTNCNFAHSVQELRRPPPNWQEIVAAHDEERGVSSEPREEFQIPSLGSSSFAVETQRSYKGRHCKKFYTDEGCPYGDNCTFLHDEQSKARESVAISLGPGSGGGYSSGGAGSAGAGGGGGGSGSNIKPSNWKTRICNKWELTGYCPFGSKCHFAHGMGELHRYGGGLVDESRDSTAAPPDSNQGGVPSKPPSDAVVPSATSVPLVTSVPHSDAYHHAGVPSQRPTSVVQRPVQRTQKKWKGPDKISRIYGDWIDDIE